MLSAPQLQLLLAHFQLALPLWALPMRAGPEVAQLVEPWTAWRTKALQEYL